MQYSQEHLKTMVYAEFGGQTECIMGNSKIENEYLWLHYVHLVIYSSSHMKKLKGDKILIHV